MAKRIVRFLFGCILVGALGVIFLVMMYGSVRAGLARLSGKDLLLLPAQVEVGKLAKNSDGKIEDHFTLKNLSGRTIIVSGAYADCPCVQVATPLPFSLSPGDEKQVDFTFAPPKDGAAVTEALVLYTNSSADPQVATVISNAVKD